ncbi:MAG: hypothetical protein WBD40_19890 [Tepidisphaeraceae bacterium]
MLARFHVCSLLLFLLAAAPSQGQPIDLGSKLELFVDRHLIDRTDGVELKLREPVKTPMAKSPLPFAHMKTVIKDGDLYRAYWRSTDPSYKGDTHTGHPGEIVRYAESRDGIEWTFPKLGLFEVNGSRDNNVIMAKMPPYATNFAPFLDARADVDPKERFKALAGYPGPGDKRTTGAAGKGLYAFVSPDGIHWEKRDEAIPYQMGWRHAFDSQNVSFWSEAEQQYVAFFRTWTDPERLRSISRSTSPDFKTWSAPVALDPNLPGEHLYTSQTHPYFRAPHIYVALPTRFIPGRSGDAVQFDVKNAAIKDANITEILFMTIRAGAAKYDRPFTQAFIRPGLDPAAWLNRANYAALSVVPTGEAQMSIYHRSGDRYTLRTDGFASATAGEKAGELVTKPFTFTGNKLTLNVSTTARGSVQVELQDADGKPLPGFTLDDCPPIVGDKIELDVAWKGNPSLSSLSGKPVRLRFVMRECDLYSIVFR